MAIFASAVMAKAFIVALLVLFLHIILAAIIPLGAWLLHQAQHLSRASWAQVEGKSSNALRFPFTVSSH